MIEPVDQTAGKIRKPEKRVTNLRSFLWSGNEPERQGTPKSGE